MIWAFFYQLNDLNELLVFFANIMFAIYLVWLHLTIMQCNTVSSMKIAIAIAILMSSVCLTPATASAQSSDNEIVNEPQAADDLRSAILRIGRRPTDSNALYDAGDAALKIGDPIVALDFFERAERLAPSSARIKSGLARTQLRLENPVEALRLFDRAIAIGENPRIIAFDRGLAYDLIGNFSRAQQEYSLASSVIASNELTIRQAISFSLAGNHDYADGLLNPLLRSNDPQAWRARSFLLAARGDLKQSYQIAKGFLPANDAENLRPYLKSMEKLTGAQQAAAVHFGHFPASNLIGKDAENIRIASSQTSLSAAVQANRLTPAGKPLGRNSQEKKSRRNNDNKAKTAIVKKPSKKRQVEIASAAENDVKIAAIAANVSTNTPVKTESSPQILAKSPDVSAVVNQEADSVAVTGPSFQSISSTAAKANSAAIQGPIASPKIATARTIAPLAEGEAVFSQAAVTTSEDNELDLDAFIASIEIPEEDESPVAAVDLDSIKEEQRERREIERLALAKKRAADRREAAARKKREDAERAEAKKIIDAKKAEEERNKARYWVQLATGRDAAALRFDYRRISRKQSDLFAGKSGSTSKWGQTNRLVVGPFDDLGTAKKFESEFRKGGGDGFVWRSGNGTIVTPLK